MHDVHLAQEISQIIRQYARKLKFKKLTQVELELGKISEHAQEISPKNLEFNLKNLDSSLKQVKIKIRKSRKTNYWKLVSLEGEK
jgi:Zn finger protein HypA/HybF involved in hydrogenase expression